MIGICYIGHQEQYDCNLIVHLFFDKSEYTLIEEIGENTQLDKNFQWIVENERLHYENHVDSITRILSMDGQCQFEKSLKTPRVDDPHVYRATVKRNNKITLYEALETLRPSRSKWGTLVGIRPVKIAHELMDKGGSLKDVAAYMGKLKVTKEKIDLVCEIAKRERPFVEVNRLDDLSLYISIPFCPSRCHYCSFPSNNLDKKGRLIPAYLSAIIEELEGITDYLNEKQQFFDCVYVGGGTPSVLTADEMEILITALHRLIDFSRVKEFTYEAGRPDTVNMNKLKVLKAGGVTRICINPQTFNEETLKQIGRNHTADEFCNAFYDMKEVDFDCINFDLILGLADETLEDMKVSIDRAIMLEPDNITVHTLAVKRASQIKEFKEDHLIGDKSVVEHAIDYMYQTMAQNGYLPYYMYRQKNMVGNLENVGFCRAEKEGLYNIRIMEERHTIIALGAGAVSKISFPKENRFERHSNPKGLEVYLEKFPMYLQKHISALKLKFSP